MSSVVVASDDKTASTDLGSSWVSDQYRRHAVRNDPNVMEVDEDELREVDTEDERALSSRELYRDLLRVS